MTKFIKIPPIAELNDSKISKTITVTLPTYAFTKCKVGDYLVIAIWQESDRTGKVQGFALILDKDVLSGKVTLLYQSKHLILKPNPSGGVPQWRNSNEFIFNKSVADRYKLLQHVNILFPVSLGCIDYSSALTNNEGFVYVLKSAHGYKIGKSKDVKNRVQLFNVKLPFDVECIYYAYFDNYHKAETELHERYKHRLLQGEWFDLSNEDIAYIQTTGKTIPEHLRQTI